jgi:hypothetical protein
MPEFDAPSRRLLLKFRGQEASFAIRSLIAGFKIEMPIYWRRRFAEFLRLIIEATMMPTRRRFQR